MDNDKQQVFQRQQVFLADVKTRMHLPVLNEPGLYNLTISVVNGQFIRTINRSLRVHPLSLYLQQMAQVMPSKTP